MPASVITDNPVHSSYKYAILSISSHLVEHFVRIMASCNLKKKWYFETLNVHKVNDLNFTLLNLF